MNLYFNKICEYLGGSHLYGLNGPNSDIDTRFIFVNDNESDIIGLSKFENYVSQNEKEDVSGKELREFFRLLRNGNTEMIETLWAPQESFSIYNDYYWKAIQECKSELMDSEKLFRCLCGYGQGERRLATGERTGKLGSKRKEAILKYNFSPKNYVQLMRLYYCGITFFKENIYPVNILKYNPIFATELLDIKYHPEKHTKEELNKRADDLEQQLKSAFDNRKKTFTFNNEIAVTICISVYQSILEDLHNKGIYERIKNQLSNRAAK